MTDLLIVPFWKYWENSVSRCLSDITKPYHSLTFYLIQNKKDDSFYALGASQRHNHPIENYISRKREGVRTNAKRFDYKNVSHIPVSLYFERKTNQTTEKAWHFLDATIIYSCLHRRWWWSAAIATATANAVSVLLYQKFRATAQLFVVPFTLVFHNNG